jgi:hypothetical protein
MQPDRSQSFQKELVALSTESKTIHHKIITTSMISPDLDNTEFCMGQFYTETDRILILD